MTQPNAKQITAYGLAISIVAILPLLTIVDSRYAKAGDLKEFRKTFIEVTVLEYEEKIEELDELIFPLEAKAELTPRETQRLLQLKSRREKIIRKLERLNGG